MKELEYFFLVEYFIIYDGSYMRIDFYKLFVFDFEVCFIIFVKFNFVVELMSCCICNGNLFIRFCVIYIDFYKLVDVFFIKYFNR